MPISSILQKLYSYSIHELLLCADWLIHAYMWKRYWKNVVTGNATAAIKQRNKIQTWKWSCTFSISTPKNFALISKSPTSSPGVISNITFLNLETRKVTEYIGCAFSYNPETVLGEKACRMQNNFDHKQCCWCQKNHSIPRCTALHAVPS